MKKLFIKIAGLSDSEYHYDFNENVKDVDLGEPFTGELKAGIELQKMQHQVVLKADLYVPVKFECDRCSKEFDTVLNNKYTIVYLFGQEKPENDDTEDIIYLPADADKINIAQEIHDYAVLSIPMKRLCKEDCKGLCPVCGTDLNVAECKCKKELADERWEPLIKLKNKNNK